MAKLLLSKGANVDFERLVEQLSLRKSFLRICLDKSYVMKCHGTTWCNPNKCVDLMWFRFLWLVVWGYICIRRIIWHILTYQDGYTALMFAAYKGHAAVVSLLLEEGASIDRFNKVKSLLLYEECSGECVWEKRRKRKSERMEVLDSRYVWSEEYAEKENEGERNREREGD